MDHEISKVDVGYQCQKCLRVWKSKPVSSCPGVPWYQWNSAPDNLKTRYQLEKMKMKPGSDAAGIVEFNTEWIKLYPVEQAIPFTDEELEAQREKRREARKYRICPICERRVLKEKYDQHYPACVEKHYPPRY